MKFKAYIRKQKNEDGHHDGLGSIIKPIVKEDQKIRVQAHIRSDGTHVSGHDKNPVEQVPELNDMGKALMKQQFIETGLEFLKNHPDLSPVLREKIKSNIEFQTQKRQKFLDMFYRDRLKREGMLK